MSIYHITSIFSVIYNVFAYFVQRYFWKIFFKVLDLQTNNRTINLEFQPIYDISDAINDRKSKRKLKKRNWTISRFYFCINSSIPWSIDLHGEYVLHIVLFYLIATNNVPCFVRHGIMIYHWNFGFLLRVDKFSVPVKPLKIR